MKDKNSKKKTWGAERVKRKKNSDGVWDEEQVSENKIDKNINERKLEKKISKEIKKIKIVTGEVWTRRHDKKDKNTHDSPATYN